MAQRIRAVVGVAVLSVLGWAWTNLTADAATPGANGDIAFVSARTGNWDIWVAHPDGTGLRNLTSHPSTDGYPAWSPDGQTLAFSSDRTGNWDIFAVSADGSGLRNLTKTPSTNERYPSWSPDGRRLAFTEQNGDVWGAHVSVDGQIVVMNLASGSRRTVASGASPSWSPDSSKVTFAGASPGGQDIFVVDARGGSLVNLTNTGGRSLWPSWSPDGNKIVYWGADNEIFVMNADGSNRRNITNSPLYDGAPKWSPDGTRITFLRDLGSGEEDIMTMAADGSDVRRVTDHPAYDAWPAWQPSTTRKYPPSKHLRVKCSKSDQARATYKVDAKQLLKMAVVNPCAEWVTVWWNSEGAPVYLQIAPYQATDLWQSQLDPMPRKIKTTPRLRRGWYPGCPTLQPCGPGIGRVWRIDANGRPYRVE
jgi:Tol biopolymer transport system component